MTYSAYTPVFSGFSTDPIVTARYAVQGQFCHVVFSVTTSGTSNESPVESFRITLPKHVHPSITIEHEAVMVMDNSTFRTTQGLVVMLAGTNVAQIYLTPALSTVWTVSGSKQFRGNFKYQFNDSVVFEPNDSPGNARPAIICWGQSNLGTGVTSVASDLESGYKTLFDNVRFLRDNQYNSIAVSTMSYLDNPSYQSPDQNGTYSLQFYLYPDVANQLARNLYVVHHGAGNTGLAVEWKPSATIGENYRELLFKTQGLQQAIKSVDGIDPDFKFMLIVHGEYDSRVLAYANDYETNLTNFINNFRSKSGLTTLPVIIVRLNTEMITAPVNPGTYGATIQTAQDNVAAALSDVYVYNPNGATMHTDKIHYTVAGEHTIATGIYNLAVTNGLI
jgi:hypothetical protein